MTVDAEGPILRARPRKPRRGWWSGASPRSKTVVYSIALGVLVWFLQKIVEKVTHGGESGVGQTQIILSCVVAVIPLMLQLLDGLDEQRDEARQYYEDLYLQMRRHIATLNDVSRMWEGVQEAGVADSAILQMLSHAALLSRDASPLLKSFANDAIESVARTLEQLNEGVCYYDGEDRDWLLSLTSAAGDSIDATSLPLVDAGVDGFDGGFWASDLGEDYLKAQTTAIRERGVRIRRIFYVKDASGQSTLQSVVQKMQDSQIDVRVVRAEDSRLHPEDFIVFDAAASYELSPYAFGAATAARVITRTSLWVEPEAVQKRIQRFAALWDEAGRIGLQIVDTSERPT